MAEFRVTTGRDGSRSFGEHDDRWSDSGGAGRFRGRGGYRGNRRSFYNKKSFGQSRRGSSGPYRSRGRGRGGPNPRSRVDDDGDEFMGGVDNQATQSRFNPYGRPSKGGFHGKNRYDNSSNHRSGNADTFKRLGLPLDDKRIDGDSQWYKIVIPWGKKTAKDVILNHIKSHIDTPFVPTYYHHVDNTAVFFVNERRASDAIRGISNRTTLPNGYKMTLIVKKSLPPNIPMRKEDVEKLKIVMSNRYDPTTKSLNLSCLHTDTDLCKDDLYMNLARPQVMTNVVQIIKDNIPELCCLNLSENKLVYLEHLAALPPATGDLKALNLAKNNIAYIDQIGKLKAWKLESLTLDGNPVIEKFSDQAAYISEIRKVFPKVLKLDGNDLPPPITFDIEARTDLPKSKSNFFPSTDVQGPIVKFLKDYFTVYDSGDRTGLAGAYHDQAMFSFSVAYNGAVQYKQTSLASYIEGSRNMKRQSKDSSRKLKKGNLIIPQLCLLPKTCHDPNTFNVDCNFISPAMVSFTVQGVFKEVETKQDKQPIRAFSRTFVTVPGGSSMLIVNDMLTITNASPDQIQSAFKTPAPTPSSSPVPQTSPSNPFEGLGLTEVQQQMIVSFMGDSQMNSEWSAKCLAENGWDYSKAGQNFLELQRGGKIPAEAFKK